MPKFDFGITPEQPNWLVEPLIPLGHLCFALAQAGVGKSLLVEDLAIDIVHGKSFCGFDTAEGDVLLIDQDTPGNTLQRRLIQFSRGAQCEKKHDLFVESMQGYSLADNTLITTINDHPTAKLIIIDCLHSVCGHLNPNFTSDMSILARLKERCLTPEKTIIINHHISEKKDLTAEDLMSDNTHTMAMGNSAIIQQADTYYIVGAFSENGVTNKLYLRPIAKRVSIKSKAIVLQMVHPNEEGERLEFLGEYTPDMGEVESDIITFFREQPGDRDVKRVFDEMGQLHGINAVRKALKSLTDRGLLVMSRHKSNLFKYRLP